MSFADFIDMSNSFLWGNVFIGFTVIVGLYFTFRSGFFSFTKFGYIFRNTIFKKTEVAAKDSQKGTLTPFEAMCVALGGCVGSGNISGVAAAIAVGGPGAVFWLWLYGIFGMTIKVVESALGCYYRSKAPDGDYFGGPMYYIEKGLGKERGFKFAVPLAYLFGFFMFQQWIAGGSLYAAAETGNHVFGIHPLIYIVIYGVFMMYVLRFGNSSVGKFAAKAVPIMTVIYIFGGIAMIIMNIGNIPHTFALIFSGAFSGTAASGGFVGATVKLAMQKGLSRAVNSNEAGQGSSPMIHAVADTRHPIEQGLWGAVEVFFDTIVVCSITSLAVISTGVWDSGATSATLTITAFESMFGPIGPIFMGIMITIFAFTTSTGWYTYYNSILNYFWRNHESTRHWMTKVFKAVFWIPQCVFPALLFYTDAGANVFWDVIDTVVALPTYINLACILALSGTFFKLLKDYKARYMGIGTVDPDFKYFYDTEPNAAALAHDRELLGK